MAFTSISSTLFFRKGLGPGQFCSFSFSFSFLDLYFKSKHEIGFNRIKLFFFSQNCLGKQERARTQVISHAALTAICSEIPFTNTQIKSAPSLIFIQVDGQMNRCWIPTIKQTLSFPALSRPLPGRWWSSNSRCRRTWSGRDGRPTQVLAQSQTSTNVYRVKNDVIVYKTSHFQVDVLSCLRLPLQVLLSRDTLLCSRWPPL